MAENKKLWGLIGNSKIGDYSIAPRMWRDLFKEKNIPVEYFVLGGDMSSEISTELQNYIKNPNFIGANIALPWKYLGYEFCDYAENSASHMDAINTLLKKNSRIEGHNTDGIGILNTILKNGVLNEKTVLIIGCGSSSQTVPFHLIKNGVGKIYVTDIIKSRAKRLSRKYSHQGEEAKTEVISIAEEDITKIISDIDILINTTPCGMKGHKQEYPLDTKDIDNLKKDCLLVEAVYTPYETPLLVRGKRNGNKVCPGVNMLVEQAAESFLLAFGERLTNEEKERMMASALDELRRKTTPRSYIIENKISQRIMPLNEGSEYKITVCNDRKFSLEKDIIRQVDEDWKEFSKDNPMAKDNITFFSLGKRNFPEEDLVAEGTFRYVQSFSRTDSFEEFPVFEKGLVPLSSLCLIETSDKKFVFGIKKNMDMKISGFSGYLSEGDIDWSKNSAKIFEYLCRTLNDELNLENRDVERIDRIGQVYSPNPLDERGLLNNRAKNNIFWVKTKLSLGEIKSRFRKNSQFNNIVSCKGEELTDFLEKNFKKMSVHCIGAIYNLFCTKKIPTFKEFPEKVYHGRIFENKKNILITGASGFIGEYLSKKFSEDYNVIGMDIKDNKKSFFKKFYSGDICDNQLLDKIFSEEEIDYVIHSAAGKHLIWCEENKEAANKSNFLATKEIYQRTKKTGAKLLFISSDQVFDGKVGDYSESSTKNAINYYGKLKDFCEEVLIKDPNVAICRAALVFGKIPANQKEFFNEIREKDFLGVQGYIVDHVLYKLKNNEKIILPEDEFCSPTSNPLLFRQLRSIIEKNLGGIFHCCGGEKVSRYEFGKKIARLFNLDENFIDSGFSGDPLRPKDVSMEFKESEKSMGIKFPKLNEMILEEWNLK